MVSASPFPTIYVLSLLNLRAGLANFNPQPTGESHNSLKICLSGHTFVYVHQNGWTEFTRTPLLTNNKLC